MTCVGIGTWAIGGEWRYGWGPQDERDSIAAIRRGLELGLNWIDTAPAYGLGKSEQIVGKAIKGVSPRPIIATKCGLVPDGSPGGVTHRLKRESVMRELEASLKNLGIDTIDVYQIHWPQPDRDIEEAWRAMDDARRQGKIRYAAVSNFNVRQIQRVDAIAPVASVQLPYSMLRRDVETGLLPYCGANNIGVIVYSPMQKGLLTGKITRERVKNFLATDHRRFDPQFNEPALIANLEFAAWLSAFAAERGRTPAQCAIAWTLRRPEVTAAIVGTRSPEQIEETARAGEWTLSGEDLAMIDAMLERRLRSLSPSS